MKKTIVIVLLLLVNTITYSQFRLFRFRESNNRQGDASLAIVIDPNASIKEKGLCIGLELDAQLEPIYLRPSITIFPALKDGYIDLTLAIGPNFSFDRKGEFRYYTGIKIGLIKRDVIYPTAGFESGFHYEPYRKRTYFGIRASYDYRGDSEYYDGPEWRQSGYILIGRKFN